MSVVEGVKSMRGDQIALICLFLFIGAASCVKYSDYDYWWHVKRGEQVYTTGEILQVDQFSYSVPGTPQYSGEWLSDLLLYFSFEAGGLSGSYLLLIAVVWLTFFYLYRTIRTRYGDEEGWFPAAMAVLLFVYFALQFRLFIRPYIFSYLFVAIFIALFLEFEKKRALKRLYVMAPLQLLWSNLSAAAIYGPILFGMFLIGFFLDRELREGKRAREAVLLFCAIVVASLISPEGINIYLTTLGHTVDAFVKTGGEFQSLTPELLWGYGIRYTYAYQLLVASSLIYFIFMDGWKRPFHLLLFLFFLAQSVVYVRMISFVALACSVFAVAPLQWSLNRIREKWTLQQHHLNFGVFLLLAGVAATIVATSKTYSFGIGIKERAFPEGALSFIEREGINGRMFNSYHLGGYIIWRLPDRKVLIDGRLHQIYGEKLYNGYKHAYVDPMAWEQFEKEWQLDYTILDYDSRTMEFPLHLNSNKNWALVYWDTHSAVYLKRLEKFREVIDKYEYQYIKPGFYDFSYLEKGLVATRSMYTYKRVSKLLEHDLALNPNNQEARLAKVFMLFKLGRLTDEQGLEQVKACHEMQPDVAMEHSAAAFFYQRMGKIEEAKVEYKRALAIDPKDEMALNMQDQLGEKE